jgi:hypothetical protein
VRYMLLLYGDEAAGEALPEAEQQAVVRGYSALAGELREQGRMLGGDELGPTSTATTVRGDAVMDGPFAETKEQLGGYFLVDAESLDEAIAIAGRMTEIDRVSVEIRPVGK